MQAVVGIDWLVGSGEAACRPGHLSVGDCLFPQRRQPAKL